MFCSSHTYPLLPYAALFHSSHVTHPTCGKRVCTLSSPPNTPKPLTLDKEDLCMAANISKSRLFQGKTSQRDHNCCFAEFKLSNYLDGVVGCQCKTPGCSVGYRLHECTNALFSSSQLCSYQFHLSLVPPSLCQCSGELH